MKNQNKLLEEKFNNNTKNNNNENLKIVISTDSINLKNIYGNKKGSKDDDFLKETISLISSNKILTDEKESNKNIFTYKNELEKSPNSNFENRKLLCSYEDGLKRSYREKILYSPSQNSKKMNILSSKKKGDKIENLKFNITGRQKDNFLDLSPKKSRRKGIKSDNEIDGSGEIYENDNSVIINNNLGIDNEEILLKYDDGDKEENMKKNKGLKF